ncbi:MAG: hypothetical protein ACLP1Y_03965 [Candidatus Acidiferrales bacterium]
MTLVEVTYQLQAPLTPAQLRALGEFSNTYGLRTFHVEDDGRKLRFEYDASRLKPTEVIHVLRGAKIAVLDRVNPVAPNPART